jgi:hypothetical protein
MGDRPAVLAHDPHAGVVDGEGDREGRNGNRRAWLSGIQVEAHDRAVARVGDP